MTRRALLGLALSPARYEELVLDAASGRVVRSDFVPGLRAPLGSLVKVFTALAYGAAALPEVVCRGAATGCWYAAGHGRMDLIAATAHSCNSYFLGLARAVTADQVALVAASYRIAPPLIDSPEARIGLGRGWLESPEALARAYLLLARRRGEARVSLIVEGLRRCARSGTAKACGAGVLAKTGTSVCVHHPAMPGDGWALGLFPDDAPRSVVLVREHGVPGAVAAVRLAARIRAL
jgi:cell division protein FtsI/penicillin-binding protein 2